MHCMYIVYISHIVAGTDRRKLIVIGKCAKPKLFKPVHYISNKRAWMTAKDFLNILEKFDRDMASEKRKFLDNCTAHGKMDAMQRNLKPIKLCYFPPSTTSHLQPLDQGIINSLKVHYRGRLKDAVVPVRYDSLTHVQNSFSQPRILPVEFDAILQNHQCSYSVQSRRQCRVWMLSDVVNIEKGINAVWATIQYAPCACWKTLLHTQICCIPLICPFHLHIVLPNQLRLYNAY